MDVPARPEHRNRDRGIVGSLTPALSLTRAAASPRIEKSRLGLLSLLASADRRAVCLLLSWREVSVPHLVTA